MSDRAEPKTRGRIALVGLIAVCAGVGGDSALAQAGANEKAPAEEGVDEEADRLLRQMSDYLADLRSFSFTTRTSTDVVTKQGQKLEFNALSKVQVKRPNLLRSDRLGAYTDMSLFYDGAKISLLGRRANLYATAQAPKRLDDAIDFARERLDLEAPGADLLYSDAYSGLTEDVVSGYVVGREVLAGVPVQHLAFRGREVDFQIWIEEGARPLPRKYVITSKSVAGHPDFEVEIDDWDVKADLPRSTFDFVPPRGATQIEFLGLRKEQLRGEQTPRRTP